MASVSSRTFFALMPGTDSPSCIILTCPRWWAFRMCSVMAVSFFLSGLSVSTNIRSKRDISAGGRSIWSAMGVSSSNLPYLGFAAASMEHLHCSVAVIGTEFPPLPMPLILRKLDSMMFLASSVMMGVILLE